MSVAKLALSLAVAAALLCGCGSSARPLAGSPAVLAGRGIRGKIDDVRSGHFKCLVEHHVPARRVGQTEIQIGSPPSGPIVNFTPTPGDAQALQITGRVESAEVIGSALLYPNQGSETELAVIENCVAKNVSG